MLFFHKDLSPPIPSCWRGTFATCIFSSGSKPSKGSKEAEAKGTLGGEGQVNGPSAPGWGQVQQVQHPLTGRRTEVYHFGFFVAECVRKKKKTLIRTDFEEEIGTSTDSIEPRV